MGTEFLYELLFVGFKLFSSSKCMPHVLSVRSQIALSKNAFSKHDYAVMFKYDSFRPTVKYAITPCTPKIIIKYFYFFFHQV